MLAWLWQRLGHAIIYVSLSVIVIWGLYAGLVRPITKPNPSTTQNGGVSYNYTISVGMGGCARIPVVETPTQKVVKAATPVVNALKAVGK